MATIYDIAKRVGVSATTVSKVFNNYTDVSEKTKKKILEAAKELGYVPNLTARSLRTDKSYLAGVIFSEDVGIGLEHQFFSVVLESFRKTIGGYGYDTIFINNKLGDEEIGYLDHSKYRNVDGLFIITFHPDDIDYNTLMARNIKCVTTDVMFEGVPFVISDNEAGAMMAVDYLYKKGHRRIGHLAGPFFTISSSERYIGYKKALEALGMAYDERYFIEAKMYKYQEAYDATLELFNRFDGDYPTALFASADLMAVAAIDALESIGLKVPDDVSIVGFDDVTLAQFSRPRLTTVKQDLKGIGCAIAEKLYKLINNEEVEAVTRMPVSIVERASVRAINQKD